LASKAFPPNQHSWKPITALQAPSIDRLHGHLGLSLKDYDSQMAITLGTGALEVFGHSIPSRSPAFVHHEPRNLQSEPFRKFFHTDGEPLKLKARDSYD
jgi:hypothetical protein